MSNLTSLSGRLAIITGCSSGIGAAIAHDFLNNGVRCVVNARRAEKLLQFTEQDNKAVSVVGDAAEESTIDAMFEAALSKFGSEPDIIIVNAGRGLLGSVVTSDLTEFEEVLKTNLLGAVRLLQKGANNFISQVEKNNDSRKVWDIVVLGSIVGRHISPFSAVYSSTKFAVNSLAEALRRELSPKGIRVTLIEPAIVESEFQKVAKYDDTWLKNYASRFGKLLSPEDVARVVNFVISQPADVHVNDLVIRPTRQDYP